MSITPATSARAFAVPPSRSESDMRDVRPAPATRSAGVDTADTTVAHRAADTTLSIRTFGPLQVSLDGKLVELPASRKTRALLAFIALSKTPQRRERLCELFWSDPPDARSNLRWSLSKLRTLLNADGRERLLADRERVQINSQAVAIDFHELRACVSDDGTSTSALSRAWELSDQVPLDDCELPDHPDFMAWLQHHRNESVRLRIQLSQRLALSPDLPAEETEKWAERWLLEAPADPRAAKQLSIAKRWAAKEHLAGVPAADPKISAPETQTASSHCSASELGFDSNAELASESVAQTNVAANDLATEAIATAVPRQVVRFARADDQGPLAWSSAGAANHPPLVKAANWLSHLELDWEAPIWSPLFHDLTRTFRFIRYDGRGCGLSAREVPQVSFETMVSDLERVVDAAGLECFPLLGVSEGACIAIEYAARHPERVSHLILFGSFAAGWRHIATPAERREHEALMVLTEAGWGRDNPCYRGLFSRSFMPDANSEELNWFDEFQRHTTSPTNVVRLLEAISRIDVRDRLKDVKTPTLVLHSQGDAAIPFATGRTLAARIPNAHFAAVDSGNHLLLGRERAAGEFLQHVRRFLVQD